MKRMKKIITCASLVFFGFCASIFLPAGSAHANLCPYPGALFAQGGFCDYPTEINGSHMHCAGGSASTVFSGPLTAAVASHSVAQVSAFLLVRGAVQTARWPGT
jgi:hypothetical protein